VERAAVCACAVHDAATAATAVATAPTAASAVPLAALRRTVLSFRCLCASVALGFIVLIGTNGRRYHRRQFLAPLRPHFRMASPSP
jgi:hypothetical protein